MARKLSTYISILLADIKTEMKRAPSTIFMNR